MGSTHGDASNGRLIVCPPSTLITWPVIHVARGLARNDTTSAMSAGHPSRGRTTADRKSRSISSGRSWRPTWTRPGRTTFTRTLLGPSSLAATRHSWSMAALALAMGLVNRAAMVELIDEIAMKLPPPARTIARAAYLSVSIVATTLFSNTLRQLSRSSCVTGASWPLGSPAHATAACNPSRSSLAASMACLHGSSRDMSAAWARMDAGSAPAATRACLPSSSRCAPRPTIVIAAPCSSSLRETAKPMPEPPPVTRIPMSWSGRSAVIGDPARGARPSSPGMASGFLDRDGHRGAVCFGFPGRSRLRACHVGIKDDGDAVVPQVKKGGHDPLAIRRTYAPVPVDCDLHKSFLVYLGTRAEVLG